MRATPADRLPLDEETLRKELAEKGPYSRIDVAEQTGSTNDDLADSARVAPATYPHLSVLFAEHQTAAHGRAGRGWETPPRSAVLMSVLVKPSPAELTRAEWLPFTAALAVCDALEGVVDARLKWPNDVCVDVPDAPWVTGWGTTRKICGILLRALPDGRGIVVGIGLNVAQTAAELPTPWAASISSLTGKNIDRTALAFHLLTCFAPRYDAWACSAANPAYRETQLRQLTDTCLTLGRDVCVEIPGGDTVRGTAVGLDANGGLIVQTSESPKLTRMVTVGDVRHVRFGE